MNALVILVAVFLTSLLAANIVAVKLVEVWGFVFTIGMPFYALTFLLTDSISELYGRRIATRVVWLGFAMSVLMVVFVSLARISPPAGIWGDQEAFQVIFGFMPRIVVGSMVAYLVAQHHDIFVFQLLKKATRGRFLWLRNNASTALSQVIDTALFVTIAFWGVVPTPVLWSIFIVGYLAKLLVAVVDTPICYAIVWWVRRGEEYQYEGK